MSYADKVRAGIALLDERARGWAARIDLASLALDNCDLCVLGQLYGAFNEGADALDVYTWESDFGFDVDVYGPRRKKLDADYKVLNRLWTFAIRKRQEVGAS